jgi:hypothetical protein
MKVRDKLSAKVGLVVDVVAREVVRLLQHVLPQHNLEVHRHDVLHGPYGQGCR